MPSPFSDRDAVLPPPALSLDFQKLMGRCEITALPNRAAFQHLLAQQCALSTRLQTRIALLVINCDAYSDGLLTQGADLRADQLAVLGRKLRAVCRRAYDVVGSLGNGEFAAMLPFTDGAGADAVARNMAAALRAPLPGSSDAELSLADLPLLEGLPPTTWEVARRQAEDTRTVQPGDEDYGHYSTLTIGITAYCGKGPLCDQRMMAAAEEACRIAQASGGDQALRRDVSLAPVTANGRLPS